MFCASFTGHGWHTITNPFDSCCQGTFVNPHIDFSTLQHTNIFWIVLFCYILFDIMILKWTFILLSQPFVNVADLCFSNCDTMQNNPHTITFPEIKTTAFSTLNGAACELENPKRSWNLLNTASNVLVKFAGNQTNVLI